MSGSRRGVRSRPKSVDIGQFRDDWNRGLSRSQGCGGAGAHPSRLGVKAGGSRAEQMAGLSPGHVGRQPSALTLTPTEDNFELSMCLIFGLREEATQTRITPGSDPSWANRSVSPSHRDATVPSQSTKQSAITPVDLSKATPASSRANEDPMKCHNT